MSKWVLYLLLFMIMVVWGFNVVAIKALVSHFPPVLITSLRIFTAAIVVFIFLFYGKLFKKLTVKQLGAIFMASLFGVLGHHIFLAIGLTQTTASNAGLILGLVPLATSICAILFLGDRLTILRFIGILFAFVGVSFIVLNGNSKLGGFSFGDILVFGGVITQAISFVLIKKLTTAMESRQVTGVMLVFGAFLLFFSSLILEPGEVNQLSGQPTYIWLVFFASAIIATGVGHLIYNYAIHRLGAGETAIFINLTPFFALVGSAFFLGEQILVTQIFGFIFIIIGVVLGTGTVDHYLYTRKIKSEKAAV